MSLFRYNSNHKAITALLIIAVAAISLYLNRRGPSTFDNGQAKRTGSVVDGRNNGRWTWYYPSGKKRMEGTFDHGKRTGVWHTFSASGDTLTEAFYADDKLNGPYTLFGPDNRRGTVTFYKNDQPIGQPKGGRH